MSFAEQEKAKAKNIRALFAKGSNARPVIFLTAGVIIGAIGLGLGGLSKTADSKIQASASTGAPPSVTHVPGASNDPNHNALQAEQNRLALEEAKRKSLTSLPVLTGAQTDINQGIELPQPAQAQPAQPAPVQVSVTPPVLSMPVPTQAVAQVPSQVNSARNDLLDKQIAAHLNLWAPAGNRSGQEFAYAGKAPPAPVVEAIPAASQASTAAAAASDIRYVRAGTMIGAKLITPLNSDNPGPVLAEITAGPLKGARLIGSMRLNKNALLVQFNQISKPGWPDTYSVSAVGMDDRFSTALATDVNNHYAQRYLGLLGGTFIEAYGKAMSQQGSTTVVDPSGGVVISQDELDSSQIMRSAQGSVLQSIGQEMEQRSNRATTVKAEGEDGSPLPIRVLFLGNF